MSISGVLRSSAEPAITLQLVSVEELHSDCIGAQLLIILAMIFLSDNAQLERDLTFDDIKPR